MQPSALWRAEAFGWSTCSNKALGDSKDFPFPHHCLVEWTSSKMMARFSSLSSRLLRAGPVESHQRIDPAKRVTKTQFRHLDSTSLGDYGEPKKCFPNHGQTIDCSLPVHLETFLQKKTQ